jgi:uncharacterized protein
MAMKYLVDTNIFLEILLSQSKKEKCKSFLQENSGSLFISDFSFHSIAVILFRFKAYDVLLKFVRDIESIEILSLSKKQLDAVTQHSKEFNLDFDDSYQLEVMKNFKLKFKTMDHDFKRVTKNFEIEFLE